MNEREQWNLEELANYAAANLPDGWEIVIRLSFESGVLSLFEPDGCEVEMCCDDSLDQQLKQAVSYVKEHDNAANES